MLPHKPHSSPHPILSGYRWGYFLAGSVNYLFNTVIYLNKIDPSSATIAPDNRIAHGRNALRSLSGRVMRFLLTLLALIAGLATPGMSLANARAQVARPGIGAEQVEVAGKTAVAAAAVGISQGRPSAAAGNTRDESVPLAACIAPAGCTIALSDRPLE